MTNRQRFLRTMRFQPVDRAPMVECGLWGQTRVRWEREGMPKDVHLGGLFLNGNEFFMWFEHYAFKTGPLVSPAIFKEFLLPRYRRVNDRLRAAGVEIIVQDTDGNPEVLIPLHLEAGINVLYPIECAADQDPVRIRKQYGHDLLLWGGIDKRALARDRKAIERELLYKLPPLLEDGGYIPMLDHTVPPDVSYDNWLWYLELKRNIIEGRYGA